MKRVCTWVFLVAAVFISSVLAAPLALKSVQEKPAPKKETATAPSCKDGDVAAATLFKAADMQSETDRRLKTLRAEKEVLHAQICGDSNDVHASRVEAAVREHAALLEANRRRCEQELTSIIPSMTKRVINVNLLEAIREAMRSVVDAHFSPSEDDEPDDPIILQNQPVSFSSGRRRRAPSAEVTMDYTHLCPTGKATSEALLAVGEAIGRATVEYDAIRQIVVEMKGGTCPSSADDMEAGVDGKETAQVVPPLDCGDLKRVVQLYIDSFTSQLPEVGKTVEDSLLEMLPEEEWCTGLEIGSTCYFLTGAQLPFNLGSANCQSHGGEMVMLKDPQNYDAIRAFLLTLSVGDIWIGATDNDGDMTFTWIDGTTMVNGDFASGEPNNTNQKCAQMWRYMNLKWDDDYCSNRKNILCMKDRPQDV
ncbi:uncharacterized protein [Branchiostoma lanceolatum]|uniref:uncharacterized protein n=1 Tax=Branchiostoma lanceolatum TaxID=7740 RepID=UPI003455034A